MVTIPAMSSRECIAALRRFGFFPIDRLGGSRVLERDGRCVVVPDAEVLDSQLVFAILRAAGVDADTFLDALGMLETA